jgi:hypothetical protein
LSLEESGLIRERRRVVKSSLARLMTTFYFKSSKKALRRMTQIPKQMMRRRCFLTLLREHAERSGKSVTANPKLTLNG